MFKREKYYLILSFKFFFLIASLAMLFVSVSASQTNSSNYGMDVDVSSGGGNISSTNYKTDVISGTITGNSSSSSYSQSFGFFSCVPYTCSGLGYSCGTWGDGCGGTLNCGTCTSGYTCSSGICVAVPVTPEAPGAAAGVITGPNFILNKDLIKVLIKQGESKREIIEIKNTGSTILNISLELENIEKFMVVSEKSFSLSLGETKSIFIDIFAKEEEIPDAYTGRIIIKDEKTGVTKIINVIIEVKERRPLFDIIVQVLSKEVLAGRDVKAKLKVFNLGDLRNIDVKLYYSIQDFDGKILSFREESVAINEELKVTRTLRVPKGTPVGDYVFYFKASYLNISASSTETFEVVERETPSLFLILLIFGIILMIVILIFMFIIFKRFLKHINKKREIEIKEMKPQEKVKIEPKKEDEGKVQEKKEKEPKVIKLIRPKIKPAKEIKEKKKPKNKVKRTVNKFVKEEKKILKKEKKVKRKLLKKIKKAVKKKKRKKKIDDLKRLMERKKKNLEYKRKVRKELRKSKRRRKPLYSRLEKIRRKRYENLLKKIIAMKKKKKNLYREYPSNLHSSIERTRKEIRKRGI